MKRSRLAFCLLLLGLAIIGGSMAQAATLGTDGQNNAIEAFHYLKSLMKNPESVQINGVYMCGEEIFVFDVSAMNGFGGYNRETYLLKKDSGMWTCSETVVFPGSDSLPMPYCLDGNDRLVLSTWSANAVDWLARQ